MFSLFKIYLKVDIIVGKLTWSDGLLYMLVRGLFFSLIKAFFHEHIETEIDQIRWGSVGGGGSYWSLRKKWKIDVRSLLTSGFVLLFSRWIVNELTFCGNGNLSRNTSDGIDYASCPNRSKNCDYMTPFWGQASSIVSEQNICKVNRI